MKTNPNPQEKLFQRTAEAFETPAKIAAGIALGVTGFADNALAQEVSVRPDRPAYVEKLAESPKSIFDELRIAEDKPKATLVSKTSTTASEAYETRLDSIIANATKAGVLKDVDDFPAVMVFDFATGKSVARPNTQAHQDYVEDLKTSARTAFPKDAELFNKLLSSMYQLGYGDVKNNAPAVIKPSEMEFLAESILANNTNWDKLLDDLMIIRTKQVNKYYADAKSDLHDLASGKSIIKLVRN
jgi:hypothetical protein